MKQKIIAKIENKKICIKFFLKNIFCIIYQNKNLQNFIKNLHNNIKEYNKINYFII